MKALSVFRSRIAPRVPGCSDMLIDQAVLDACIEFSEKSLAVKRMMDPFNTQAGVREYDLDTGVVMVAAAWRDGSPMTALTEDDSPARMFAATGSAFPGTPSYIAQVEPDVVALFPTPDAAYSIVMRAAIKPTRSATQVEDQLFDQYCDAVVDGALSRLYALPGEFASPALADRHENKFKAAVADAMLDAQRGQLRAETRVRPVHI